MLTPPADSLEHMHALYFMHKYVRGAQTVFRSMYRLYGQRCSRWTPSSAICSSLRCFRRDDRIERYCLNGRQSGRQRSNLRKYCIDYIFIMSAAADLKQPRYSRSLVCGQRRSQGTPPSANSLLRWLRLAAKTMRCTRAVSPLAFKAPSFSPARACQSQTGR